MALERPRSVPKNVIILKHDTSGYSRRCKTKFKQNLDVPVLPLMEQQNNFQ